MRDRFSRLRQSGFSMIEIGLALILISGASFFVFNQYTDNSRRQSIAQNVQQIVLVASEAKRKFASSYGSLDTPMAAKTGVAPPELVGPDGDTVTNSYGGAVNFIPFTLVVPNDSFKLVWSGVPVGDCVDVLMGTQSIARKITIGATKVVKATDAALNIADASVSCFQTGSTPGQVGTVATLTYVIGR